MFLLTARYRSSLATELSGTLAEPYRVENKNLSDYEEEQAWQLKRLNVAFQQLRQHY